MMAQVENSDEDGEDHFQKDDEERKESNLDLTYKMIQKVLKANHEKKNVQEQDLAYIIEVIISIFENMHGQIDSQLPNFLQLLFDELKFQELPQSQKSEKPQNSDSKVKSALIQAISMSFSYDSILVFDWLKE